MLEVTRLTKYYGALPGVIDATFDARPGQVLGYLGPNGSGKSTTVRMLVGLSQPDSGDVLWQGRSIYRDLQAYRHLMGYVPEEPHLYTHLTAPEYLRLVAGLRDFEPHVADVRIDRLLDLFDLANSRHSTLGDYSKGMRQRVLIAAALLHDPHVLILDEPFSGLDVGAGLVLREIIRRLAEEGRTIVMSSHVIAVVEQLCSDVIILSEGRIVARGRIDSLPRLREDETLEHVFLRLAVPRDVAATAQDVLAAVRT